MIPCGNKFPPVITGRCVACGWEYWTHGDYDDRYFIAMYTMGTDVQRVGRVGVEEAVPMMVSFWRKFWKPFAVFPNVATPDQLAAMFALFKLRDYEAVYNYMCQTIEAHLGQEACSNCLAIAETTNPGVGEDAAQGDHAQP